MPSNGSRAPMFVKSSAVLEYETYGAGSTSPRFSPTNPLLTHLNDTRDETERYSPTRSPVNMLLATDLTEAIHARGAGNRSADTAIKTGARWPYLKQQAARHVYGNLRSRLQNREPVASSAVCMTYSQDQEQSHRTDGIHIQTFGIRPKSCLCPADEEVTKPPPQLTTNPQTFEKKKYRISFKLSQDETDSVSAPTPTAESAASKPNAGQGSQPNSGQGSQPNSGQGSQPKSDSQQIRRSKTAREYYRPKREPLVRFDATELPQRFQHRSSSVPPKTPTRVTWTDVMTAKPTGVYRDTPDGLGGPRRHGNGSKVRLYLSSELWGILDEDIGAIKTVADKS